MVALEGVMETPEEVAVMRQLLERGWSRRRIATELGILADRHKSETPCNTTGLSPLGGQGAVRAWGSYTKPIPRGFPRPAAC